MRNTRKCCRFANRNRSHTEGSIFGAADTCFSLPFRVVGVFRGSVQRQFPGLNYCFHFFTVHCQPPTSSAFPISRFLLLNLNSKLKPRNMRNTRKCCSVANRNRSLTERSIFGTADTSFSLPFRVVGVFRGSVQRQFPGLNLCFYFLTAHGRLPTTHSFVPERGALPRVLNSCPADCFTAVRILPAAPSAATQ